MNILTIGKPAINVYLPLEEFPLEGDVFTITGKNESLGNVSAVSACLLAKWGIKPYMTGVIGNDAYGEKVRNTFSEYKVNTKFIETNFESGTTTNYFILDTKNGKTTRILFNNPRANLERYKYDFVPDIAILDGTDVDGDMAFTNNFKDKTSIFYARNPISENIEMSKKCTWVIGTESFAIGMTKYNIVEGSTEEYVNLYQKLVDIGGRSNYIIILNNHKILYCEDSKVKMLPEMKINVADNSSFDSIFVGSFTFCIAKGLNLDNAIKFANTAAAISMSRIGEEPGIPKLTEVVENSGLQDVIETSKPNETTPVDNTNVPGAKPDPDIINNNAPAQPMVNAFTQKPVDTSPQPVAQVNIPNNAVNVQAAPVNTQVNQNMQQAQVQPKVQAQPNNTTNIFDNKNYNG